MAKESLSLPREPSDACQQCIWMVIMLCGHHLFVVDSAQWYDINTELPMLTPGLRANRATASGTNPQNNHVIDGFPSPRTLVNVCLRVFSLMQMIQGIDAWGEVLFQRMRARLWWKFLWVFWIHIFWQEALVCILLCTRWVIYIYRCRSHYSVQKWQIKLIFKGVLARAGCGMRWRWGQEMDRSSHNKLNLKVGKKHR